MSPASFSELLGLPVPVPVPDQEPVCCMCPAPAAPGGRHCDRCLDELRDEGAEACAEPEVDEEVGS